MVEIVKSSNKKALHDALYITSKAKSDITDEIFKIVKDICTNVDKNGNAAVIKYSNEFDNTNYKSLSDSKVTEEEINAAYKACSLETIEALEESARRIKAYNTKIMPEDVNYTDDSGVRLGNLWKPMNRIGIYVPGGLASYPSSVLMNAVPAIVAGVKEIVMTVPAPYGKLNPAVLAAAKIAGITEIYKIGGAHAIAALARSTETLPHVDKIVGPGNAYVAAAKKYYSGAVGIDMIAGPSEILVVADNKNNPDWIAADLLSQAEHDEDAQSILITNDEEFAKQVIKSVEEILKTLERKDIARKSWENNGRVILADAYKIKESPWDNVWDEIVALIDGTAPEHLELALDDDLANEIAVKVTNAGAIFLGRYTPEAIGDYTAGPSHVLPTSGTARFSSGLSVYDFLKRVSLIGCTEDSFKKLAKHTETLANEEGLGAHALSVSFRNPSEK